MELRFRRRRDMRGYCSCCKTTQPVGAVGGKIACSLLGAALGKAVISNPLGALACGVVGLALGEFIDREVVPRCPACGTVLQAIAAVA
jgi:hypothetical protein